MTTDSASSKCTPVVFAALAHALQRFLHLAAVELVVAGYVDNL